MKGLITKLHKLQMVTDNEHKDLIKLHKTILNRWIGLELGE